MELKSPLTGLNGYFLRLILKMPGEIPDPILNIALKTENSRHLVIFNLEGIPPNEGILILSCEIWQQVIQLLEDVHPFMCDISSPWIYSSEISEILDTIIKEGKSYSESPCDCGKCEFYEFCSLKTPALSSGSLIFTVIPESRGLLGIAHMYTSLICLMVSPKPRMLHICCQETLEE